MNGNVHIFQNEEETGCEIYGFDSAVAEDSSLLECYNMLFGKIFPMF
jgi:hypothetical protein